jgi:ketosteroid isomerase-like protein
MTRWMRRFMTRWATVVAILAWILAAGCDKRPELTRGPATAAVSDERAVLAADDAYAAAEVRRDDAALRRLVDDRFQRNHDDGMTSGKEAFVAAVLRLRLVDQVISERSVIMEGPVGIVMATTELHFDQSQGPRPVSRLRYTATYVKRDDTWLMLALHIQGRAAE